MCPVERMEEQRGGDECGGKGTGKVMGERKRGLGGGVKFAELLSRKAKL